MCSQQFPQLLVLTTQLAPHGSAIMPIEASRVHTPTRPKSRMNRIAVRFVTLREEQRASTLNLTSAQTALRFKGIGGVHQRDEAFNTHWKEHRMTKTPNKVANAPLMLTPEVVATKLRISEARVLELCDSHEIAHVDMGTKKRRYVFIPETAIKLYKAGAKTRQQKEIERLERRLKRYRNIYGSLPAPDLAILDEKRKQRVITAGLRSGASAAKPMKISARKTA
jgi:hypothetical protein